jgi:DNA-binding CsgD family transcriptional regulator
MSGRYEVGDAAVELADRAWRAPLAGSFRREVLDVYGRLVPYDTAVFTEGGPDGLTTAAVEAPALALIRHCEENTSLYLPDWRKGLDLAQRTGGFLDHEVFSIRERWELPLYCEVVRPQGVRSTVMVLPRWQGEPLGMIRLERHEGPPFTPRDLARALQLLPTVALTLRARRSPAMPAPVPQLAGLTEREAEIAGHVARGLTTRHIALILGTSPLTVRNQICRVFDKTRVASRAELAALVTRNTRRN